MNVQKQANKLQYLEYYKSIENDVDKVLKTWKMSILERT